MFIFWLCMSYEYGHCLTGSPCLGLYKAAIKVLVGLQPCLETRNKSTLDSLRSWHRFSSFQLQDWGHFNNWKLFLPPKGCRLLLLLVPPPKCCPLPLLCGLLWKTFYSVVACLFNNSNREKGNLLASECWNHAAQFWINIRLPVQ